MHLARLVILAAAPLAYLLGIAGLAASLAWLVSLGPFGGMDFGLLVTRGAQVLLLISLVPLSRFLGVTAAEIGYCDRFRQLLSQLIVGFLLGLLILSLHVSVLLGIGAIKPNPVVIFNLPALGAALTGALWVAFLVASMEELIFRGVMFACLRRFGGSVAAAAISATYYALLHFVKSDLHPSMKEATWSSGFEIWSRAADYLFAETPLDSLLALFCAGLFLAAIRCLIQPALGLCIGIHAGWVTVIKAARRFTDPDPHAPYAFLVGPYDQIIGYGAALWITLLLIIALLVLRRSVGNPDKPLPSA